MIRSFLAVILGLLLSFNTGTFAQQAHHLTILHLNDSHSNLVPGGPRDMLNQGTVGGLARAATIINRERMEDQPVLTLHAGDLCIGDPMHSLLYDRPAEFSLLAALGLDAMAVGNHEFDLTPMYLHQALSNTLGPNPPYPLLSANLDLTNPDPDVQALNQYIQPATIKQYPGFKVGIFGLTTPATMVFSLPYPVDVIGYADPSALMYLIAAQVADLRGQGCDVVVCLSHMGVDLDQVIASSIPGIDVIVGGHSHSPLAHAIVVQDPSGHPVSIVQTGGRNRQIGKLHIKIHKGVVSVLNYHLIDLDSSVPEDPTIKGIIDGIANQIEAYPGLAGLFSQPVAFCTGTLTEEAFGLNLPGNHDTHVGNLVADAFLAATGADIAVQAGGSTAQPLYPGPILPVDIYRMNGYGFNTVNTLGYFVVTLDINGGAFLAGLEATLADLTNDEMVMQVSSSMSYTYDPTKAPGSRVQSVVINGAPLDPTLTYTIACNEIVPLFLTMLGIPFNNVVNTGYTEFEVMMNYIATLGTVGPSPLPGRVRAVVVPKRAIDAVQPVSMAIEAAPNPFSSDVLISVSLSDETDLALFVIDVLGRKVATLGEGRFGTGRFTKAFQADALQPGVYFVVAHTGDGGTFTARILKAR